MTRGGWHSFGSVVPAKAPVGQTVTSAISSVQMLQVYHCSIKKKTTTTKNPNKKPLSTQSGKPGVLPQRRFGYRAPSIPCSAENAARLKPTHPGCVSVPKLIPGKFPLYEKDKNKKKIYAALCLVLCVCFAALRLENCSSKSSGSCDNVESSSSVTQQSADSQCYHSMSSIE